MRWVESDGGRAEAGFRGQTGDCAVRAVAVATGLPYREAYDHIARFCREERPSKARRGKSSPRTGVHAVTLGKALEALGWRWVPTSGIGQGTTVHLEAAELPGGRLVARCSRHFVGVVDGVAYDTHDPRRDGKRAVYGYWRPE